MDDDFMAKIKGKNMSLRNTVPLPPDVRARDRGSARNRDQLVIPDSGPSSISHLDG